MGLNRRPRNHASYVTYDCDLHSIRHGRICRWTWRDRPLKKWPGVKMRRTRGSSSPCSGLELPICYAVSLTCSTRGQPCTAPPLPPTESGWLHAICRSTLTRSKRLITAIFPTVISVLDFKNLLQIFFRESAKVRANVKIKVAFYDPLCFYVVHILFNSEYRVKTWVCCSWFIFCWSCAFVV